MTDALLPAALDFSARQLARRLLAGGVLAYPTEGVWGLGCDPWNADAVGRILAIKERSVEKGLIIIANDYEQLAPFLAPLSSDLIYRLTERWPGPFTWVVEHNGSLPDWVTGNRPTIAVRVPGHPMARALCRHAGMPLVSTSANRGGKPAMTDRLQVRLKLGAELDGIAPGKTLAGAQPSQIRDLLTEQLYRA
ncbi:L-threonylcarbamoyladenylate synthase [Saccharospirillum impatiens]|uniref:L-threonylcarbamoyladenylate synthase n=1 Tax=Saccharospirillum impatiens TaxID=169438 RepID=UPI00040DF9C9|nr:L-threonylcarbamoyladenylate synthase [Saccharospirillum impatiens]